MKKIDSMKKTPSDRAARNSNLELLRIVSMFLVLLIHYVPFRTLPSQESLYSDVFGTLFNLELRSLCFVCVNCFVLISGYFGIKWKKKSFVSLLFQILFWSVLSILVVMTIRSDYSFVTAISVFVHDWLRWFVVAYLGLYMLAPVLNSYIEKVSAKNFGIFILIFYVFSTLFGWFGRVPDFNEGMSVISLVGLYLGGAYIRKTIEFWKRFPAWYYLVAYFVIGFVLTAISVVLLKLGITKSIYGYLNPLVIVESMCLFLFFNRLDIGNRRWINWLAASSFAVYLFHIGGAIYPYYQNVCKFIESEFANSFIVALGFFVVLFMTVVIVDQIRILLFGLLFKRKDN